MPTDAWADAEDRVFISNNIRAERKSKQDTISADDLLRSISNEWQRTSKAEHPNEDRVSANEVMENSCSCVHT